MILAVTDEDKNLKARMEVYKLRGILSPHKEKLNQSLWEGPGNISCQLVACGICMTHR